MTYIRSSLYTLAAASLFVAVLLVGGALAQDPTPSTTVNIGQLLSPWMEWILGGVVALILAIIGWLAALFHRSTGIQIDVARMEALQTAIRNGAGKALLLLGEKLNTVELDLRHPAVRDAVLYVNGAVPEAIKHFGLTPDELAEKVLAMIGVLTAPSEATPRATTAAKITAPVNQV